MPRSHIKTQDATWIPTITNEGRVGYCVVWDDARPSTYIYLNPSTEWDPDGGPDVFVYTGPSFDIAQGHPEVFIDMRPSPSPPTNNPTPPADPLDPRLKGKGWGKAERIANAQLAISNLEHAIATLMNDGASVAAQQPYRDNLAKARQDLKQLMGWDKD